MIECSIRPSASVLRGDLKSNRVGVVEYEWHGDVAHTKESNSLLLSSQCCQQMTVQFLDGHNRVEM